MLWTLIHTAFAASFTSADTPASMTWEYTYTSPISLTGDTVFTFTDTSVDTSSDLCAASLLCMDGDFTTADGGEGPFATDAFRDACTDSSPPPAPGFIEVVPRTCDVIQTVDLTYIYSNGTFGPEYAGEAYAGELSEFEVHLCIMGSCMSLGFFGQTFLADPMDFSGDLGGLGGLVTGTFIEL